MYDLIIIGSGCSGLSAGMYSTRMGLKTLILGEMPGGLITTTHLVENWPGIKSISGPDLGMQLYEHAMASGAEFKSERVEKIESMGKGECTLFKVKTGSGEYESKTVLIATGTEHRKLGVKGESEFENKGVSYCALCDGAFFKGQEVAIVGGGDSAAKEALFLSEHASKVYILVRKNVLRAEPINAKRVAANEKIEVMYETEIEEIKGGKKVEMVKLKGGDELKLGAVFVAIGHIAQTGLAKDLGLDLNGKGEIVINRKSETSMPGVFAAGDCCDTEFKQAITGSAEGVTAAYYAFELISKQGVDC